MIRSPSGIHTGELALPSSTVNFITSRSAS